MHDTLNGKEKKKKKGRYEGRKERKKEGTKMGKKAGMEEGRMEGRKRVVSNSMVYTLHMFHRILICCLGNK